MLYACSDHTPNPNKRNQETHVVFVVIPTTEGWPDGYNWVATLPDLPGAVTQAKSHLTVDEVSFLRWHKAAGLTAL